MDLRFAVSLPRGIAVRWMVILSSTGFSLCDFDFLRERKCTQAEQVAEKVLSLVGRAFRHDIKSAFSSGVLTPEGPDTNISATCEPCATKTLCPHPKLQVFAFKSSRP